MPAANTISIQRPELKLKPTPGPFQKLRVVIPGEEEDMDALLGEMCKVAVAPDPSTGASRPA